MPVTGPSYCPTASVRRTSGLAQTLRTTRPKRVKTTTAHWSALRLAQRHRSRNARPALHRRHPAPPHTPHSHLPLLLPCPGQLPEIAVVDRDVAQFRRAVAPDPCSVLRWCAESLALRRSLRATGHLPVMSASCNAAMDPSAAHAPSAHSGWMVLVAR